MSEQGKLSPAEEDINRLASATPRRSVSFGVEDSVAPSASSTGEVPASGSPNNGKNNTILSSNNASGNSSLNPTPPPTLRSALKPSASAYKKLPPAEQYQHKDPLLRRLRLVDEKGKAINLKQYFGRDVKCVGFYFSSQWAGQPLKEYHKTITEFAARHQNEFKVIYVSVDVDEQWYKAGVKGKPWVSMVWDDGSSPPPPTDKKGGNNTDASGDDETPGRGALYNGEDFLLGGEPDIDESLSHSDTSGEAYLRPFSRVHLASKLNIIAAPTLCVYHLPTGKMLDWNVRMTKLQPGKDDVTWSRWREGEKSAAVGLLDAAQQRPMTVVMLVFSILYYTWVRVLGPEYNYLQQAMLSLEKIISPARDAADDAMHALNHHPQ